MSADPVTVSDPMTVSCGAKTSSGGSCQQQAGWGTDHIGVGRCKLHGGASPQAQLSGVVALARRESVAMGRPLDVHPHEAIIECIRIAAGEVYYASERIAELEPDEVVAPVETQKMRPMKGEYGAELDTPAYEISTDVPALHVWIQVRQKAMDRLVQYSAIALKAGVEERRVRIAEGMAEQIADAMKAFATAMGLNPADPSVRAGMRTGLLTLVHGDAG